MVNYETSRGWKVYLWIMSIVIAGPPALYVLSWIIPILMSGTDITGIWFLLFIVLMPVGMLSCVFAFIHAIVLAVGLSRRQLIGGWKLFAVTSLALSLIIMLGGFYMALAIFLQKVRCVSE